MKTSKMIEQQMLSKSAVKLKMRVMHRSIVNSILNQGDSRPSFYRRALNLLKMKTGCGFTLVCLDLMYLRPHFVLLARLLVKSSKH